MCRFLLFSSAAPVPLAPLFARFADMARRSRSYDGDWQGDGWGFCRRDETGRWHSYISHKPVWEERDVGGRVPPGRFFLLHARSASFAEHKGDPAFNQPFIHGEHVFVFNGLLRGVHLPVRIGGRIGSQKIWNLLRLYLRESPPAVALERLTTLLQESCREVQALNIGLCDGKNLYAYTSFTRHEEYYHLRLERRPGSILVVSEPLADQVCTPLEVGRVHCFAPEAMEREAVRA